MNERQTIETLKCPRCGQGNAHGKEYCGQCGAGLIENCPSCLNKTSVAERFCGNCGTNIEEIRQQEITAVRNRLEMLNSLEGDCKFGDAILIARSLIRIDSDRFPDELKTAKKRLEELTIARQAAEAAAEKLAVSGKEFLKAAEYLKAASRFGEIHPNLRTPEVIDMLAEAIEKAKTVQRLREEIQAGLATNPLTVFGKIAQLIDLVRTDSKLEQLGNQLRDRVIASAATRLQTGAIHETARLLAQIPDRFRDDKCRELEGECAEILWIEQDVKETPFVDETLVGFTQRLAKLAPKLPKVSQWVEEGSRRWRDSLAKGVDLPWVGKSISTMGLAFERFDTLQGLAIEGLEIPGGRGSQQRFSVAIGLALQAVGKCEIDETLEGPKSSKSFLSKISLFSKKKSINEAWGLDLGTSSIKAAKVVLVGGEPKIEKLRVIEFRKEQQTVRTDGELREALRGALVKLRDEGGIGTTPCLVSLGPKGSLTRFISLPSMAEAKFGQMVELEAKHQIPYSLDQVYWYWHRFETSESGQRSVMIIAARRQEVDDLAELLQQHDINVIGYQCEPVALLNRMRQVTTASSSGGDTPRVLLEMGASHTHVVAANKTQVWMRSITHGASRLTSAIARETLETFAVAEQSKIAMHKAARPHLVGHAIEVQLQEFLGELERSLRSAEQGGFPVKGAKLLLSGGGSRLHLLPRALAYGFDQPQVDRASAGTKADRAVVAR